MTTQTLEKPLTPLAVRLNGILAKQPAESPLTILDRCDRCNSPAVSKFTFGTSDLYLCGHHSRSSIEVLLDKEPADFWISPAELFLFRGVEAGTGEAAKTGDGLTDG